MKRNRVLIDWSDLPTMAEAGFKYKIPVIVRRVKKEDDSVKKKSGGVTIYPLKTDKIKVLRLNTTVDRFYGLDISPCVKYGTHTSLVTIGHSTTYTVDTTGNRDVILGYNAVFTTDGKVVYVGDNQILGDIIRSKGYIVKIEDMPDKLQNDDEHHMEVMKSLIGLYKIRIAKPFGFIFDKSGNLLVNLNEATHDFTLLADKYDLRESRIFEQYLKFVKESCEVVGSILTVKVGESSKSYVIRNGVIIDDIIDTSPAAYLTNAFSNTLSHIDKITFDKLVNAVEVHITYTKNEDMDRKLMVSGTMITKDPSAKAPASIVARDIEAKSPCTWTVFSPYDKSYYMVNRAFTYKLDTHTHDTVYATAKYQDEIGEMCEITISEDEFTYHGIVDSDELQGNSDDYAQLNIKRNKQMRDEMMRLEELKLENRVKSHETGALSDTAKIVSGVSTLAKVAKSAIF